MTKRKVTETFAISLDANRYDNSLTAMARLIYIEIRKLCNKKGFCWAQNSYLADKYNISTRSVSRHLKELEGKYIRVSGKSNKRNIYIKDLSSNSMDTILSEPRPTRKLKQKHQPTANDTLSEMSKSIDNNVSMYDKID